MDNTPDPNSGLPGVPDGANPRGGANSQTGLDVDVQDSGGLFLVGSVPAESLVEAMDVLSNVVIAEEVYNQSVRTEAWDLCKALTSELLSRSRMIHGG